MSSRSTLITRIKADWGDLPENILPHDLLPSTDSANWSTPLLTALTELAALTEGEPDDAIETLNDIVFIRLETEGFDAELLSEADVNAAIHELGGGLKKVEDVERSGEDEKEDDGKGKDKGAMENVEVWGGIAQGEEEEVEETEEEKRLRELLEKESKMNDAEAGAETAAKEEQDEMDAV